MGTIGGTKIKAPRMVSARPGSTNYGDVLPAAPVTPASSEPKVDRGSVAVGVRITIRVRVWRIVPIGRRGTVRTVSRSITRTRRRDARVVIVLRGELEGLLRIIDYDRRLHAKR